MDRMRWHRFVVSASSHPTIPSRHGGSGGRGRQAYPNKLDDGAHDLLPFLLVLNFHNKTENIVLPVSLGAGTIYVH